MNKKYYALNNLAWLAEQRQIKSRKQLSDETGIPSGSIQFSESKLPDSIRAKFVTERRHEKGARIQGN